jgi:quinol monooxygenase YgiN
MIATRMNANGIDRREFVAAIAAAAFVPFGSIAQGADMYGLIGKAIAVSGKRDDLIAILLEGATNLPGCLSYVVAKDASDPNAIWISEVWTSKAAHDASLSLPSVKDAIAKGRPLIAGFGERIVTEPIGGYGLAAKGL